MTNDNQSKTDEIICSDGGSYIGQDVNTGGGDFVGRDKITNQITIVVDTVHDAHLAQAEIERKAALYRGEFTRLHFEPETVLISDDQDQTEQNSPGFRLGKYPVTNAQYAEFLGQNPKYPAPRGKDWFLRSPTKHRAEYPVIGISWYEANAYCRWLHEVTERVYRLPYQEEWVWAACGLTERLYPWGDSWLESAANVENHTTTVVTAHPDGASPYGCLDMIGNVQEWTATTADTGQNERIHCGGYYGNTAQELHCRIYDTSHADTKIQWRSFRVLLEV